MPESTLRYDRYHLAMANFALGKHAVLNGERLADLPATFYVAQRKMPFAPCVGHERLLEELKFSNLDRPRTRFLKQDKADLSLVAEKLASASMPFKIRCVMPGTIIFPNEPFADINGPFADTLLTEIMFQHAFDEPMTVAGNALAMHLAAGKRWLTDFSLRRDGNIERACEIAKCSYIGGFHDTSNVEAAFRFDLNPVGTMAHFLIQAYTTYLFEKQGNETKHFEQTVFENWLDAHPKGTTLLVCTISVKFGVIHAIKAALSSPARKEAFKLIRIDSFRNLENLIAILKWSREILDKNGLNSVGIFISGDMDAEAIKKIVAACPFVHGFGVGTKLAAETRVAGVIFKLCEINGYPTQKLSSAPGKETLPGQLQVWRCRDKIGMCVKDIISVSSSPPLRDGSYIYSSALLTDFWVDGGGGIKKVPTIEEQRAFVKAELACFKDIENYPIEISPELQLLRESAKSCILQDEKLEEGIEIVEYPE